MRKLLAPALLLIFAALARAQSIDFQQETLDNGLHVIYAPLHNAPVVHVRVLYHVGSRDETPDRQGFAHMFEHMMFRGSAHVKPEEHMKLIGVVGGDSNAHTSFDETVYVNTLPSNNTQLALWLEADRMASFKVNADILKTERKVVAQEWMMRYANQPLGTMFQDLAATAFNKHSYHWTPIGDMDQLRRSTADELQTFFNTYYVPNNATLVIAGDIDVEKTKGWVHDYFGWIPKGADIARRAQPEPQQTEPREKIVAKPGVPLATIYQAYKTIGYRSDDHDALSVLGDILSGGDTGRLDTALVNTENPLCINIGAGDMQLEDPSLFVVNATVAPGKDPAEVRKKMDDILQDVAEKGVTQAELDKVRTLHRIAIIKGRETCEQVADQLAEEAVFGGDPNRVNTQLERLNKLTTADIQRVAKTYLVRNHETTVVYKPAANNGSAATQVAKGQETMKADVVPSTQPVEPRVKEFPAGFPTKPPVNTDLPKVTFNKGVETKATLCTAIAMQDKRLPLVNVSLVIPAGGDAEKAEKAGLGDLTAELLTRGAAGKSYVDFSTDLQSRGIQIGVSDDGDHSTLNISCTSDQLDYAVDRAVEVLNKPNLDEGEFARLKDQTIGELTQQLSQPPAVAERELKSTVYPDSPLGRTASPATISTIGIEDVRGWYKWLYQHRRLENKSTLVVSGDVDDSKVVEIAKKFSDWPDMAGGVMMMADPDYTAKSLPDSPRVFAIDNPNGRQATIRFAVRAYDLHNDDKYAGSVAGQILSAGIESRLNKYVRAEKGLTYGCYAFFRPNRHGGTFSGTIDTNINTAEQAVAAMFEVFDGMKKEPVSPVELHDAQTRVAGAMVMEAQTIGQQATMRINQILNGYPIDYYDKYAERLAKVTADEVKAVMNKYVDEKKMTIVVVAPAEQIKDQMKPLGEVTVQPMPAAK